MYLVWAVVLFLILYHVTREFFTTSLSRLSERLNVSNNVAGVTFLSFGNGATDVVAGMTSVFHGSPEMAGGLLVGGGIVAITLVVACVVLSSNEVKVQRRPFLRDVIFYLLACSMIYVLLLFHCIALWQPLLLLMFYGVYVIVVIVGRMIYQTKTKRRREALGIIEDSEELMEITEMMDTENCPDVMLDELLFVSHAQSPNAALLDDEDDTPAPSVVRDEGKLRGLVSDLENLVGWKEMNFAEKALFILAIPVLFIECSTMPLIRDDYWRITRFFICLSPIAIPLSILAYYDFTLMVGGFPVAVILAIVGLLLSILFYFLAPKKPRSGFMVAVVIVSVLMGSFWMYVISTEIMGVLRSLGKVWGASEVIIGLTLFAWGNSMVDLISTTEVAKQGFKNMAFSACLGASSFSLLFGLGTSIGLSIFFSGATYEHSVIPASFAVSFVVVAFTCVLMVILVPLHHFIFTNHFAIILIVVYIAYLMLILMCELKILPFTVTLPPSTKCT